MLPALRELSLGLWFDEKSVEPVARAFGPQLDTLHWSGRVPRDGLSIEAIRRRRSSPGTASLGAHVDGEFVVGMTPGWRRRPLQFGDDGGGPWFEGGVVTVGG